MKVELTPQEPSDPPPMRFWVGIAVFGLAAWLIVAFLVGLALHAYWRVL